MFICGQSTCDFHGSAAGDLAPKAAANTDMPLNFSKQLDVQVSAAETPTQPAVFCQWERDLTTTVPYAAGMMLLLPATPCLTCRQSFEPVGLPLLGDCQPAPAQVASWWLGWARLAAGHLLGCCCTHCSGHHASARTELTLTVFLFAKLHQRTGLGWAACGTWQQLQSITYLAAACMLHPC